MRCPDGRGSVINPFIFHQIKAHFAGKSYFLLWDVFLKFIQTFIQDFPQETGLRGQINKLKCLFGFLFRGNAWLAAKRQLILTANYPDIPSYLNFVLPLYEEGFSKYTETAST